MFGVHSRVGRSCALTSLSSLPTLRSADANRESRSASAVSHRSDGLLHRTPCGLVASRCRPWGSPGFWPCSTLFPEPPSSFPHRRHTLRSFSLFASCSVFPPRLPSCRQPPQGGSTPGLCRRRVRCRPHAFPLTTGPMLPWALVPGSCSSLTDRAGVCRPGPKPAVPGHPDARTSPGIGRQAGIRSTKEVSSALAAPPRRGAVATAILPPATCSLTPTRSRIHGGRVSLMLRPLATPGPRTWLLTVRLCLKTGPPRRSDTHGRPMGP